MDIKWNAQKYTEDFSFVHQLGNSLIELINTPQNSLVLDLGCGNGALTKKIQEKGYFVKGLDSSQELLNIARKNYPDIEFIEGDARNFTLPVPVDVVFSNAVFHWIEKDNQESLIKSVYNVLKPNGEFVFEFGGYGNNRCIHHALKQTFAEAGYDYKNPFYFPTISQYASLLENNGFCVKYASLFNRMTELKGENGLKEWIKMFIQKPFFIIESEQVKEEIINNTVKTLKNTLYMQQKWYADYVRIRMKAVRL